MYLYSGIACIKQFIWEEHWLIEFKHVLCSYNILADALCKCALDHTRIVTIKDVSSKIVNKFLAGLCNKVNFISDYIDLPCKVCN
mgnify:CR=1 FL=1